jgi:thiosulfate/3-mercaptopyruvate sulfurtransferase
MESSLVETSWLADHLSDPDLRVVDARWRDDGTSRELYKAGHISGAVPLDWHLDLNDTASPAEAGEAVRDLLLPPERFAEVMAQAGIGDGTFVVAYAETDHSGAARLWWALRYYGHDRVAVLDGGITKWVAEGRALSQVTPRLHPAVFKPRPRPALLATKAEILEALKDPGGETAIVDTRPPEQYRGQAVWTPQGSLYLPPGQDRVDAGGRELRGGHIPGAVSLPSPENLDPADWTFLSPSTLRERASDAGLSPEQRVITYCGVGISASLGLFSLYLAGYENLALYDASWEEWGHDPDLPIERD